MLLIRKGAEANLYLARWHGLSVILKKRISKAYRIGILDNRIRSYRTVHEAQLIHEAKTVGVPTPVIYMVDRRNFTIVMEYIEGSRLKEALDKMSSSERLESCKLVGVQIARLHKNRIIHGDLTTSNMIVTADDKIFFIDFGLSFHSIELEDKGADLHLMRRALDSAHYKYAGKCFNAVIEGYAKELGKDAKSVLLKMKEIERRGRYFEER